MPPRRMPAAEVPIDTDLVRRLVADQFPHWAALEVAPVDSPGWDNALFRLGPELLVRLPRRALGAGLVPAEQRWLPVLAPTLPLPVPVPIGCGVPGAGYPWPWSVCRWLPGRSAAEAGLTGVDPGALATALGEFMAALHVPAPPDAPRNPFRGIPLAERDESTRRYMGDLEGELDVAGLRRLWDEALGVPPWRGPDVWVHGDLHPANLILHEDRLHAVVDFGDLCAGDPATDLSVAWMLLPGAARGRLRAAEGADDDTWARGRGWAVSLGLACLANSADNPIIEGIGRRTVAELLRTG